MKTTEVIYKLCVRVQVRPSLSVEVTVDKYKNYVYALNDKIYIEKTQKLKCEIIKEVLTRTNDYKEEF